MRASVVALALAAAVAAQEFTDVPPVPSSVATFQSPVPPSEDPSQVDITNLPYLQSLPWYWFQSQGYQELACGYGHIRNSEGHCVPASWYNFPGCYQTVLIHQTVIQAEAHTVTVTQTMQAEPMTVTHTATVTETAHVTETTTDVMTTTAIQTETKEVTKTWVSTETIDHTSTIEHTLTSSFPVTVVHTQTETDTATVTAVHTVVQPTIITSVVHSTETIDQTQTVVHTLTNTETQMVTSTVHDTATETSVVTSTLTSTEVVPTTVTSTVLNTITEDGTTQVVTETSTVVSSTTVEKVWTKTETATATATATVAVIQTQAVECVVQCKQNFWPGWQPTVVESHTTIINNHEVAQPMVTQINVGHQSFPQVSHGGAVVEPQVISHNSVVIPPQGHVVVSPSAGMPVQSEVVQPVHSVKKRRFARERN